MLADDPKLQTTHNSLIQTRGFAEIDLKKIKRKKIIVSGTIGYQIDSFHQNKSNDTKYVEVKTSKQT